MRVVKRGFELFLALAMLFGCTMLAQNVTPQDRYDDALARWNSMMREYRVQYALQDAETQKDWDKKFSKPMYEAGMALGSWHDALDDATKERAFTALKNQVLRLLVEYGIVEIGEMT